MRATESSSRRHLHSESREGDMRHYEVTLIHDPSLEGKDTKAAG
jgi:hypothetical protein